VTARGPARRPDAPSTLEGVVLCGGASRRMGRDKALLELDGETLIARAVEGLGALCERVVLACGPTPRYAELGRELVCDRTPDAGPLAGLEAGLAALHGDWLAVCACDMPAVEPAVYRALHARARAEGLDGCMLATEQGVEPLLAVYHKSCLGAVRDAIARGERRLVAFHGRQGGRPVIGTVPRAVLAAELDVAPEAADWARNLNRPEDLERERELRAPQETSR